MRQLWDDLATHWMRETPPAQRAGFFLIAASLAAMIGGLLLAENKFAPLLFVASVVGLAIGLVLLAVGGSKTQI